MNSPKDPITSLYMPLGGVNESSYGREHGEEVLKEFVNARPSSSAKPFASAGGNHSPYQR